MKSPRFDIRAAKLKSVFSPITLEKLWKEKIRVYMRQQFLNDGIENFDFHINHKLECLKLSQSVLSGSYSPSKPIRILVEKGKGLCRQLVIPSVKDAIVLQALSDALYMDIKDKSPTKKSFYQPKEHKFSSIRSGYGTFAAWINFQKELFNFSQNRKWIVVTDIANYYDNISYSHLRNSLSTMSSSDESLVDMLIYVLSDLLWQPDYTPRVEIGLPQMNLDAPRLLAHCFLYELDSYIDSDKSRDFVRYMDDIDIGVNNIYEAKEVLKCVDLVLQTKQIRLNSGKTQILSQKDAIKHFRARENARLDIIQQRIDFKVKASLNLTREKNLVKHRLNQGLKKKIFDDGNGEKILKRWIGLASRLGVRIAASDIEKITRLRPNVRETVFAHIRSSHLTSARAKALKTLACSGHLVDQASKVDMCNYLNETKIIKKFEIDYEINEIILSFNPKLYFDFYGKIWLQSKHSSTSEIFKTISNYKETWIGDDRLGRLVGSLTPLFYGSTDEDNYFNLIASSYNSGARECYKFHKNLSSDASTFNAMFDALKNPNPSRGTKITHAKFLCLLSSLKNPSVPNSRKTTLRNNNHEAFSDIYYKGIAKRLGV